MAYVPNEWKTGDIVTSEKLTHLEEGVVNAGGGGNVFVINGEVDGVAPDVAGDYGSISVDKTIDEIKAALEGGSLVLFQLNQVAPNSDYNVLNEMAGIYGIFSYDFDTAGDWSVVIQQMSSIIIDELTVTVMTASVNYSESGDPAEPNGGWGFSRYRKDINLNSGPQ